MENRVFAQGAELTGRGVSFRTWATGKKNVSVVLFGENESILRELQLERETTGYYSTTDSASSAGTLYKYRLDGGVFPILHLAFNRRASMVRRRSSMDVRFAGQIWGGNRLS